MDAVLLLPPHPLRHSCLLLQRGESNAFVDSTACPAIPGAASRCDKTTAQSVCTFSGTLTPTHTNRTGLLFSRSTAPQIQFFLNPYNSLRKLALRRPQGLSGRPERYYRSNPPCLETALFSRLFQSPIIMLQSRISVSVGIERIRALKQEISRVYPKRMSQDRYSHASQDFQ